MKVAFGLLLAWILWCYPFIFRAPHRQKRPSITAGSPTRLGLLLESMGIFVAFVFHRPDRDNPAPFLLVAGTLLAATAIWLSWTAVSHLGKQFRVQAGLYHDHELVRTGPYAVVRHPIYSSLLAMLLCTLLVNTPWKWFPVSLALFILGTEIRVRTEDGLLASRFGEAFEQYRRSVPAYIPFVR